MIGSRADAVSKMDFLTMLVAQMTNQDPLSPMEGTEFATQLAQFSSLEELQTMSGQLDGSLQANLLLATSINNSMATTLIGKTVRAQADTVELAETGEASVRFLLGSAASEVSVEIVDENGETVRTLTGANLASGANTLAWDGCDDEGNRVAAGNYSVRVTAKDSSGNSVTVTPFFEGVVTGVMYRDGVAILLLGSREINLGDVIAVYDGSPQRIPPG
jgi:flagellar basal-body rod modification protein FlgD